MVERAPRPLVGALPFVVGKVCRSGGKVNHKVQNYLLRKKHMLKRILLPVGIRAGTARGETDIGGEDLTVLAAQSVKRNIRPLV